MRLAIDPASIAPPAVSPVAIRRAAERQQATIAKRFGVSVFTIRKVWRDAGLPPRKSSPVY